MGTKKLWSGCFDKQPLEIVDEFNASVKFDYKLWPYDIEGSMAHVRMLAKQNIISKQDAKKILKGLQEIAEEIKKDQFVWKLENEDVHLNIEARLIEKIGPVGGKIHTARSRNDQVALDIRLYCRESIHQILGLIDEFERTLLLQAKKHIDTIMPGYTHLQRAQPIVLAHHLLAYFEMLERDYERLLDANKRVQTLSLGAGAIAGTTFPIDRKSVAEDLGFARVAHNSMDAVSDRDFILEILSHLSILSIHLTRFAEELILWSTAEFSFVKLPQEYCTGSSMMPQKVNPDVLELIRGKAGRGVGHLMSLLMVVKALPLTYNKDLQEDKEALFDSIETASMCLKLFSGLLEKLEFRKDRLLKATQEGGLLATDAADYLASKGLPFREAHHVSGALVKYCLGKNKDFESLNLEELRQFSDLFKEDVFEWLNMKAAVNRRKSYGGTAISEVNKQIKRAQKICEGRKSKIKKGS